MELVNSRGLLFRLLLGFGLCSSPLGNIPGRMQRVFFSREEVGVTIGIENGTACHCQVPPWWSYPAEVPPWWSYPVEVTRVMK